jgi:VanZ family protein
MTIDRNMARNACLVLALSLTVLVWVMSLLPQENLPHAPGGDKLHHALSYAGLMLLWGLWARTRAALWAVVLLLTAMGIAIELAQRATGYRSFEWADMLADTLGILVGVLLLALPWGRRAHLWIQGQGH